MVGFIQRGFEADNDSVITSPSKQGCERACLHHHTRVHSLVVRTRDLIPTDRVVTYMHPYVHHPNKNIKYVLLEFCLEESHLSAYTSSSLDKILFTHNI